MIIRVGTDNPMKVEATRQAFARSFGEALTVLGVPVDSTVRAQPLSFGEIARGARERARRAFRDCRFGVGIEAGIFRIAAVSPRAFQITLACVTDGAREALGAGPFYEVPAGSLRDVVGSDTGTVAVVTQGRVTREQVTRDAVQMALAPFLSPELYGP